MGALSFLFVC
ncbi:hypothetical protein CISIN_1g0052362mg, partial [Citrus sinensis]